MREKVTVYKLVDIDGNIGDNTIMYGTINDVRTWAKNLWKKDQDWVKDLMGYLGGNINEEEEYYTKLDEDLVLFAFLEGAGYCLFTVCEVPFDDFYDDKKPTQELIDEVLFQIKVDIAEGDLTALDEMLKAMPIQQLVSYLPEK